MDLPNTNWKCGIRGNSDRGFESLSLRQMPCAVRSMPSPSSSSRRHDGRGHCDSDCDNWRILGTVLPMAKRLNGEGSVSARPRADGLGSRGTPWSRTGSPAGQCCTARPALRPPAGSVPRWPHVTTRSRAASPKRSSTTPRPCDRKTRTRPGQNWVEPRGARCSTRYIRIADVTPGGMRDVWIHPESIESVEATDNGQTIVRLRSGRPVLVDRQLDAVLQAVGQVPCSGVNSLEFSQRR